MAVFYLIVTLSCVYRHDIAVYYTLYVFCENRLSVFGLSLLFTHRPLTSQDFDDFMHVNVTSI